MNQRSAETPKPNAMQKAVRTQVTEVKSPPVTRVSGKVAITAQKTQVTERTVPSKSKGK